MMVTGNNKKEVFTKVNLNVPFTNYRRLVIVEKVEGMDVEQKQLMKDVIAPILFSEEWRDERVNVLGGDGKVRAYSSSLKIYQSTEDIEISTEEVLMIKEAVSVLSPGGHAQIARLIDRQVTVLTEAQLREIAKRMRAIIRAGSKGVGDLPVAIPLDGLLSFPALRFNGGISGVVEAPTSKLQDMALDAVSGVTRATNEAVVKANTSAGNADKATTTANNATKSAGDAAGTTEAATEAAKKATDTVNGTASNATSAATKAFSVADTANKEASSVNTTKSETLAAATHAGSTATIAEAEVKKMKQLQESISGATSLAPTRMELTYTKRVTQRNPHVQRTATKALPSYSLQNVLFLGDDVTVSADLADTVTPLKNGTGRIHVIPTQATRLYKTIDVTVQAPSVRLTGDDKIRIDSKGRTRLT